MTVDISIISAGVDTSGFLPYIRNHIHSYQGVAPNPVEVEGVPQMVNAMLERCGRELNSIRAVRIFGHGVCPSVRLFGLEPPGRSAVSPKNCIKSEKSERR